MRQDPGVNAQIVDSLQTNQQVMILKKENLVLKLGERNANWYKISYQKGENTQEGYIWGGNLCVGYRNKNGYDFLLAFPKPLTEKTKNIIRLKSKTLPE